MDYALAEVHRRAVEGEIVGPELVPRLLNRHLHLPYAPPETVERLRAAAARGATRYLTVNASRLSEVELVE